MSINKKHKQTRLLDVIDFKKLDTVLEGFNKSTGFVTAILDLEGNILSQSGWRQICTEFHRVNPETAKKCHISDTNLANKLTGDQKSHYYKCLNGLVDVAVPVIINGEHIANLFSGQLFFEEPDRSFFQQQARKYGFDQDKYLEALAKVPVVSKEKVRLSMEFLLNMARLISDMTLHELEQMDLNKALRESEERFRVAQEMSPDGFTILHPVRNEKGEAIDFSFIYQNQAIARINGTDQQKVIGKRLLELFPNHRGTSVFETYLQVANNGETRILEEVCVGEIISGPTWLRLVIVPMNEDIAIHSQDITERKLNKEQISQNKTRLQSIVNILQHKAANVQELLDFALNEAINLTESKIGYIYLFNEDKQEFTLNTWSKGVMEQCSVTNPSTIYQLDKTGIWGEAVRQRKDIIVNDFKVPHPLKKGYPEGHAPLHKYLTIPVFNGKRIIAVVGVANKETDYDQSDVLQLKLLMDNVWKEVEAKQSEEALRLSEEMMRNSQTVASICSYSTHLNVKEIEKSSWVCSPEFYKIFGIDETYPHTIEGWANFIHPDYREEIVAYHGSVVKEKLSFNREYKIIRISDGAERWVHGTGKLEFDEKRNPVRMHGAIQDITKRKRTELIQQLQYNIARATISTKNLNELFEFIKIELNNIIDAKNFVVAFYNEETGMLSANVDKDEKDEIPEWSAEKSITGYVIRQNRPVLLKKNEILRLHEEGIIELFGTISEVWLGVPLKVEGKTLGAVMVQNYYNPDAYDHTSVEIMELVAHELSLFIDWQRSEEKANKLSRAVEQSSASVVITNREGVIEYVNPFFTKLTGYCFEEVKGKNPNILQSGHQSKAFYKKLWDTILSGSDWEGEMLNKKKNGALYWEQVVISPIVDNEGVIISFVAIKEDITESKKMLEDLLAAKDQAEESDRLKSAFLANMSHEIRTPMNGILGFADLLKRPNLTGAERQKFISIIEKSGTRLLNIINDIIDISKIETGQMNVCIRESNVNEQIEYIHTFFSHEVSANGIAFTIADALPENEAMICTDREKVFAILTNLVKNAIKYTKEGSIELGCVKKGAFLEFYVKDTGTGIPESRQKVIFDRFIQADIEDRMALQGAGLGLSISKAYVELLGGNIWLESKEGVGSTFYFTLPNTTTEQK